MDDIYLLVIVGVGNWTILLEGERGGGDNGERREEEWSREGERERERGV